MIYKKSNFHFNFTMSLFFFMAFCLFPSIGVAQSNTSTQRVLSGPEITRRAESSLFPEIFTMTMTIVTEKPGEDRRSMTITSKHEEGSGTFMEIQAPARSRGIRFLTKEESLWMFNPRSNSRRAIRLSPRASFQGTVFSNNDVGDTDYSDDYNTVLIGSETIEHSELGKVVCYVIEGDAVDEHSTYGKVKMWVEKETFIPLEEELYAKSGLLYKKMHLSGIKELAGRRRATVMEMESMEQKGAVSTIHIEEMEKMNDLPDSLFSQSALTR